MPNHLVSKQVVGSSNSPGAPFPQISRRPYRRPSKKGKEHPATSQVS